MLHLLESTTRPRAKGTSCLLAGTSIRWPFALSARLHAPDSSVSSLLTDVRLPALVNPKIGVVDDVYLVSAGTVESERPRGRIRGEFEVPTIPTLHFGKPLDARL